MSEKEKIREFFGRLLKEQEVPEIKKYSIQFDWIEYQPIIFKANCAIEEIKMIEVDDY